MAKNSTTKSSPEITIGDNARVPIPNEDRGKLGQNHILGVITSVSGSFYAIGTSQGV